MAGRTPLFLARSGYRSRRLSDAARALPVLGLFLLLVPVLWSDDPAVGAGAGSLTADVGIYLFIIWALLIAVAALLAPRLPLTEAERSRPDTGGPG